MHTDRFVVFRFQNEWLVTYADRRQSSFETREDAERSAFDAADAMASHGHAVSVLIIPDGPGGGADLVQALEARTPDGMLN